MSLIYTHPSGGKLFQCGAHEISHLLKEHDIDLLILAAKEYQPSEYQIDCLHVPLDDTPLMNKQQLSYTVQQAQRAAREGARRILYGQNVLSTCVAGLNRSSLISGFILKILTRCPGYVAIEQIRKTRSFLALFNPLFANALC